MGVTSDVRQHELEARLRGTFLADARTRVVRMRASLAELPAQLEALSHDAHTVRGGAAVCGVTGAVAAASRVEELLEARPVDTAAVEAAVGELERELERLGALPEAPPSEPRSETALTVVHVDDDPTSRALIERVLALRPHIRLVSVEEAGCAATCVRDERPALVLLDLRLPGVSGWEVLRAIRADPATRDVPVVLLSGDAGGEPDELPDALLTRRLQKPFGVDAFLALVDEVCPAEPVVA